MKYLWISLIEIMIFYDGILWLNIAMIASIFTNFKMMPISKVCIFWFKVFDDANKPKTKRKISIKFKTKLILFCTLRDYRPRLIRKIEQNVRKNIVQYWFYETSIIIMRLISKPNLKTFFNTRGGKFWMLVP